MANHEPDPNIWRDTLRQLRLPFNRWRALRRLRQYHEIPRSLDEVVSWAMDFGGGGLMRIKTLQRRSEITRLAESVRELHPSLILEIGTARGGTLLIWSTLASEEVITCDLNDLTAQTPLFTRLPPPGSNCRVTLLSGNSHEPDFKARVVAALAGRQVDFLFIDGDHRENGVTADYLDYSGFVRPGGIIAFHDIVANQPLATNQVHPFWQRLKQVAEVEEFIEDPAQCGFGIGIMRVPATGAPALPDRASP
jgi:cephalosporin hydroxylase